MTKPSPHTQMYRYGRYYFAQIQESVKVFEKSFLGIKFFIFFEIFSKMVHRLSTVILQCVVKEKSVLSDLGLVCERRLVT